METVRYQTGEAIRWIAYESDRIRSRAAAVDLAEGDFGHSLKSAVGAAWDFGKSTYAGITHESIKDTEYILLEDRFELVKSSSIKSVPYKSVRRIEMRGDKATCILEKGTVTIKPPAYIVAGAIKVPVGWNRNGMEVPYFVIIEELAARCGIDVAS
jgi:hypothetical protein